MERNFFYRVEICFPILDPELAKIVKKRAFDSKLNPISNEYKLNKDGSYKKILLKTKAKKHKNKKS